MAYNHYNDVRPFDKTIIDFSSYFYVPMTTLFGKFMSCNPSSHVILMFSKAETCNTKMIGLSKQSMLA